MPEEPHHDHPTRLRAQGRGWWLSITGPGVIVALIVAIIGICAIAWRAMDIGEKAVDGAHLKSRSAGQ